MKRSLLLIFLLLIALSIGAVSINEELIPIREDLFNSQEELDNFDFQEKLSPSEEAYYSQMEFYLLTGGPGSLVWENFGHSAFIVETPNGQEISFDYGIFSFGKDFYKNFALGRLYYSLLMSNAFYREESLKMDDRTVEKLPLLLNSLQKRNLLAFLTYNAQEENNTYLYNYYFDNCATRLRDSYNAITEDEFRLWATAIPAEETLRSYSKRYLSRSTLPIAWAINYLLGPSVDSQITLWEAMFLPDVLNSSISEFQNNNPELIYKTEARKETPLKYNYFFRAICFSLLLGLPLLLTKSKLRGLRRFGDVLTAFIYLILGIMASVLLFLMCASIHDVTYFNANVLIISPIFLLLAILHLISLGKKERRKALKLIVSILLGLTIAMAIIKTIGMNYFIQENIEYYLLALYLYLLELLPIKN